MSYYILIFAVIFNTFNCLKAKKAATDAGKSSSSITGSLIIANYKPPVTILPEAPKNIQFSGGNTSRMIPGQLVEFRPTVTGVVSFWSISPSKENLPTGLIFDPKTGAITGTPSSIYLTNGGFPLVNFSITANNPGGNTSFILPIKVLTTGENVWTVMNGVSGTNTESANAALLYEPICNCLYLAGTTFGNLNGEINPTTSNQAGFLSKYDLNGNRIWTKLFGTAVAANTGVSGMAFDSSGNIFLTGYAPAGNFSGLVISASVVGYVIKYDSYGNILWVNSSAPTIYHTSEGVTVDSSGNPHIAVTQANGTTLHGFSHSLGSGALTVIKYNGSNGTYGGLASMLNGSAGTPGMEPYGIRVASNGNFYVIGVTRPTNANRCGNGSTSYNSALFRFDSSLNYLGCTQIPVGGTAGGTHAFGFGIAIDPSTSDVYVSGYFNLGSVDGNARLGSFDTYVTKFDSLGTKLWTRTLGVAGAGASITTIGFANGKLYLAGVTSGNLPLATQAISGSQDMFIATYNTSGTHLSLRPQGTTGSTIAFQPSNSKSGLTFDSNNTLYTSSFTDGNVGGITNPTGGTNSSVFLVRNVQ